MQQSVDIARPLEEVFAFVANPANDARWGSQPAGGHPSLARPAGGGNQVPLPRRFAGRQFELVREVPVHEPNRRQVVKTTSGPLRFGGVRTFEAISGGTRITLTGGGRAGGFFDLPDPLLLRVAQRSLRTEPGEIEGFVGVESPARRSSPQPIRSRSAGARGSTAPAGSGDWSCARNRHSPCTSPQSGGTAGRAPWDRRSWRRQQGGRLQPGSRPGRSHTGCGTSQVLGGAAVGGTQHEAVAVADKGQRSRPVLARPPPGSSKKENRAPGDEPAADAAVVRRYSVTCSHGTALPISCMSSSSRPADRWSSV
jgi:polyketide cyclase/dehydrase/lipid transport protein